MTRAFVIVLVCIAQVASAAPRSILVLRSDGAADTASRTSIDSHVLRLAKNIEGKVDAGDITLTEAAAAVGCDAKDTSCRDQVLDTFGVDEIVATTITPTATGLTVSVHRLSKNGPPKSAQTTIAAGKAPDAKLNADIGPLFGLAATTTATVEAPLPATTQPTLPPPPPTTTTPPPAATTQPAPTPPLTRVEPVDTRPIAPATVTAAPVGTIAPSPEGAPPRRRLQKIGMGGGAAFMVLGVLMWTEAADTQGKIDDMPEPRSPEDFRALRDLENKGDDLAGAGNLFVIGGAALAGISAYFYWRAGRSSSSQTARIAPVAYPGGAGITLTLDHVP